MKYQDAKRLSVRVAQVFPGQVTEAQAAVAVREFQRLDRAAVEAAIDAHRKANERVSWPDLFKACESASPPAAAGEQAEGPKEGTWFDVRRRLQPQLASCGDVEVCLRVHRAWWVASSQTEGYRRQFLRSCKSLLVAAGVAADHRDSWALTITWEVPSFRQALDDVRTHYAGRSNAA